MNALTQARIRMLGPDTEGGVVVEFCKHTGPKLVFVVPPNAENECSPIFRSGCLTDWPYQTSTAAS